MGNTRVYYIPFKATDSDDGLTIIENPNIVVYKDTVLMPKDSLLKCRSEVPLRKCFCGNLPEFVKGVNRAGETCYYYNCDSTIDENFNHFLMADKGGNECEARKNWNELMEQIDKCYGK